MYCIDLKISTWPHHFKKRNIITRAEKYQNAVWTTLSIYFLLLDYLIPYKNPSVLDLFSITTGTLSTWIVSLKDFSLLLFQLWLVWIFDMALLRARQTWRIGWRSSSTLPQRLSIRSIFISSSLSAPAMDLIRENVNNREYTSGNLHKNWSHGYSTYWNSVEYQLCSLPLCVCFDSKVSR